MKNFQIHPSGLSGEISSSPSKSHTLRAILFASMANGESVISHYLLSPDAKAMIKACRAFGAVIEDRDGKLHITGVAGQPRQPDDVLDAGNSGQVLRFALAMLALQPGYVVMTGDHSIRHNRPMQPLIDGFTQLGAFCVSKKDDGYAPIVLKGPIKAGKVTIEGQDSQPVSALLMAAAFLDGESEICVNHPGEKPWVDLTLSWLKRVGVSYTNEQHERYTIQGPVKYKGFEYAVPGDFSSLLFPVVAAIVTRSTITIRYVDMEDVQGDKKAIEVLKKMGADIRYNITTQVLTVNGDVELVGMEIDVNDFIDSVPVLAVVGCYASGETHIVGAAIARKKECDRIAAITKELKKMNADIEEEAGGLIVRQSALKGTLVKTYHDHRIVMALTVAGLGASGVTTVEDSASVSKSYPDFYRDMRALGANIKVVE